MAYNLELGPLFPTPGYNFRYQPGVVEHGHSESEEGEHDHDEEHAHSEDHGHDEAGEHREHSHVETGHSHDTYGNEIFFMLGTTVVPYVTPSMFFVFDLNNTPGSYLEVRIDRSIPLSHDIFRLQPYTLLGVNLGYNTTAYTTAGTTSSLAWKINRFVSIFGSINYSVAMTALKEIDQGNEVRAGAGVTFSY